MTMSALEEKWAKEEAERTPTLEDAYDDDGSLAVEDINESVLDRIPKPTGW